MDEILNSCQSPNQPPNKKQFHLDNITISNSNIVYVKRKKLRLLLSNLDKIYVFFGVKLIDIHNHDDCRNSEHYTYHVFCDNIEMDLCDITKRVQHYIDSLTEAEDSSYDSDCDADDKSTGHQNVSRTVSDTLGQEFAEYVGQPIVQDRSPGYIQRVEFALKLGYTERLVQAALARLGPNPAQNELLAELIKLGAQQGSDLLDSPNTEQPSSSSSTNVSSTTSSSTYPQTNSDESTTTCFQLSTSICCELRPIVIDGSNVAMSHGNKEIFSCRGIKLCVDWFKNRGHKDITVFVPKWRKESSRPDNPIKDQEILCELEKERMLVFTPSRLVSGKRLVCYDDRYILKLAAENDGIVVSNDNYRDLVQESNEFKKVVEERVLMYSFVNDRFMPPDDPLGRSGPTLENFLRVQPKKGDPPPPCPYGKKCTYGNKCKFHHPERGFGPHKSVTERLSEHAARHLQARNENHPSRQTIQGKSLSVPLCSSGETSPDGRESRRKPVSRTKSGAPEFTTTSSVLENLKNTQYPAVPPTNAVCLIPVKNWENSQKFDKFPKSHSIENISRELYVGCQMTGANYSPLWARQSQCKSQQTGQQQQVEHGGENRCDDGANLHRKLQRQLTLNPAGCDPRIYQMQQRVGMGGQQQQQQQQQQHSSHQPLTPSLSGPRSHPPAHWNDIHQNVTRIASAPDPSRPWHGGPPPASSSEPHINLWPQQHRLAPNQTAAQDQRRRLHYHLASIFPEDQVQTVMQRYPDETNPQKICAAILNMFPKID